MKTDAEQGGLSWTSSDSWKMVRLYQQD